MVPLPTGGSVLPKLVGGLVVLGVLTVVIKHPNDAAVWVRALAEAAGDAIDGVASFFRQIAG
ncbi:hypothetical protein GCM10027445_50610 [Amycolatopsis endophytica]|uniref:L-lactate permease n=1 Tax=Amycolatopsis endophytica TaxID=860233 RepID=A0A853AZ03_9PSEU|nr:hypothetical protein [Amycolatopsis endophytica]NYI87865.1 L-lactate permease [Amycolatopsis endophytica]